MLALLPSAAPESRRQHLPHRSLGGLPVCETDSVLSMHPLLSAQIQMVVPAGYARNGASASRNFTFHACLSPASRQQVRRAAGAGVGRQCGGRSMLLRTAYPVQRPCMHACDLLLSVNPCPDL